MVALIAVVIIAAVPPLGTNLDAQVQRCRHQVGAN